MAECWKARGDMGDEGACRPLFLRAQRGEEVRNAAPQLVSMPSLETSMQIFSKLTCEPIRLFLDFTLITSSFGSQQKSR